MRPKTAKYYKLQHFWIGRLILLYYLLSTSHRNTFDTLWASGDAQIHTRRLTPAKLPHCSIAALAR